MYFPGEVSLQFVALWALFTIVTVQLLYNLFRPFLVSSKPRSGEWAVVTGATDGIGKALAMQLASRGYKMLLVARSAKRLTETADEIRLRFGESSNQLEIKTLVIDFNSADEAKYDEVVQEINQINVGILVNNVGAAYPYPMFYHEVKQDFLDMLINVNLRSTLRMTAIVYKGMVSRKSGKIICIGSGASQLPCDPLHSAYVCVKGGIEAFCRTLQVEAFQHNISVQYQVPLLVTTKLSKCKHPSISIPSPERFAISSMRSIDCAIPAKRGCIVCPYWFHWLQLILLRYAPGLCSWYLLKEHEKLRKRALLKLSQ
ncbi:putative 3-ketoacyl-CoA reductase [Cardiosporidium cionae]|uniref:3-ketoacyl-CoA reductase n=1 Tax=Cardiosporidium cionae TaxID=476202 RepID=A0ABQ7JDC1_9APIC|nr:putative 3-ketoacyl-CoA reductase [Cardiosporidium cionae]|eukprot:KAF8821959.1 putative 3-ketoacyl-CoA reductase [Cardiosporidium cionae]